jgi:hypothetical protein
MNSRGRDLHTEDHIEELVKTASLDNSTESRMALHHALDSVEVYHRATIHAVEPKRLFSTPLLRLKDGTHAMMVYTSKSHPDLADEFAGASWRHTLEIASTIPQADWLILTNRSGDWIAISKSQISGILNSLPSQPSARPNDPPGQESAKTSSETLDSLISQAAHIPTQNRSDPILEQLQGRELYLRLAGEPSEGNQPVMITSKVGDIGGLVQAYTTRSRPGITYGGMTWEAIVDMINNAPHIPGVHIINDNDDWIVLGRPDITRAK